MKRKDIPFILILIFLLSIFFYDVLFMGRSLSTSSLLPGATPQGPFNYTENRVKPFTFDLSGNALVNEPNPYIIKKAVDEGSLPLWSPYEGLGMPLLGNPNTEVLNPLKAPLNLMPGPFMQDVFFLLRLLLLGIFTYLFLREAGHEEAASLFGASAYMLSGYSIWWINLHPLSSGSYMPAVFYFYERWSKRGGRLSPFLGSLSLSFAFFGGKAPDVIMGAMLLFIYAVSRGFGEGSFKGLLKGCLGFFSIVIPGLLMASASIFPFIELQSNASPIAGAVRTGASSHTIPLITSITLWQPLFLGIKDYFYGSWLKWTPPVMMPYIGMTVLFFFFYGILAKKAKGPSFKLPFYIFSLFIFLKVYGIIPEDAFSGLPVLGSMNFLKYNGMFYFSMAAISASGLEDILSSKGRDNRASFALILILIAMSVYLIFLYGKAPEETLLVFALTSVFLVFTGLGIRSLRGKAVFPWVFLIVLLIEFFIYMPKGHPKRYEPYKEPPSLEMIKEAHPYRIIGGGASAPPLVSSAMGLYDIRGIDVLIPSDYYFLFQRLVGFSVPYTNNPDPLFSATSPFIDLLGVKYILNTEPLNLDSGAISEKIKSHIASLRTVKFLAAMKSHSIKGGASIGFREGRFSFVFPLDFGFSSTVKVDEPFFPLTLRADIKNDKAVSVSIKINGSAIKEAVLDGKNTIDEWLDLSGYTGRVITISIEGGSPGTWGKGYDGGTGAVTLSDFGISKGRRWEDALYKRLLELHLDEVPGLWYLGEHNGIHIYENANVMKRAFLVKQVKKTENMEEAFNALEEGLNFRETAPASKTIAFKPSIGAFVKEAVDIKKYTPTEAVIDVRSGGGLLILSDLYWPGWKAEVNGKGSEVIRVFGALRGVVVPDGNARVVFYYRPVSFYAGAAVSFITFVLWAAFLYHKGRRLHL
jgi:hypothetical protein